ncbi:MAG: MMPL family transporter [Gammaproteobacteria bacterium]
MKDRFTEFVLAHPVAVYVVTAALVVLLGLQIPRIQIDTDPENMLPADQPQRVFHNDVKQAFGLHDAIVVGIVNESHIDGVYNPTSLAALKQVTDQVLEIDGVIRPDLMSLSVADNITQAGPGTIRFEWMMAEAPRTREASLEIRRQVERLPFLADTLVSGDGRAAAIYVPIEDKDESYRISSEIQAITEAVSAELGADDAWHITGLPVAEDTFGYEMFVQMGISAPLAGLAIFILMWLFFRNLGLIVAPMIVAIVTVVATMGLLIGLGFTVHIMSSMIPIFLMPIAVVDSIHIMSEFADRYTPGSDRREVIREVVGHLFRPMLFTSVTSGVGFVSLALTPIPPVQVFGWFVGFGILLAFILTITFVPVWVSRMKPERLEKMQEILHRDEGNSLLARILRVTGKWSLTRAPLLLAGFGLIFVLSLWGVTMIQINDNPVRWFKADHRIRVADEVLNHHFAGTYDAYFVLEHQGDPAGALAAKVAPILDDAPAGVKAFWDENGPAPDESLSSERLDQLVVALDDELFAAEGDAVDALESLMSATEEVAAEARYFQKPEILQWMQDFQAHLNGNPRVGKTNALPDLVKTVNRELRSGEPDDYVLPGTYRGVAQALLQFQSSHRPQDLWHMVTPDYRRAVVWLQMTSGDNQDMTAIMEDVERYLDNHPLPENVSGAWAGKTYINVVWQEAMVAGMVKSLAGAFVVVFAMMVLLFRSFVFGALAMLPLTLTITFIYGLIGWVGKDYDMPIAVLSALTLGLSVDFAIHFLERTREAWARTGEFHAAMTEMFEEPARAIARNAIVIAIGFTPLLVAPLVPYVTVGVFLASIMAISAVVTLIMLPAVMSPLRNIVFRAAEKTA